MNKIQREILYVTTVFVVINKIAHNVTTLTKVWESIGRNPLEIEFPYCLILSGS